MKLIKKILCVLSCVALLTCAVTSVSAASVQTDTLSQGSSTVIRGILTVDGHLNARLGYDVASYHFDITAPADAVGIQINDMPIATTNALTVSGTANEVTTGTGDFGDITIKITVFFTDKAPYIAYETFHLSDFYCGASHPIGPNCYR